MKRVKIPAIFLSFLSIFTISTISVITIRNQTLHQHITALEKTVWQTKKENVKLNLILRQYQQANTFKLKATAYTTCVTETNKDNGNTATMQTPVAGWTVAVSPDLKSWLGKRVYIDGIGVRKVIDLMNKRYTRSIDILVGTKAQAFTFGTKALDVYLIEPYLPKG